VPRWFISSKSEIGAPYVKPYFSAGYGLPNWLWTGVDLSSILTTSMLQVYSGLRVASPVFEVAFGGRETWSFDKPSLSPSQSFDRDSVLNAPGPKQRDIGLEFEATGTFPLPHAAVVGVRIPR
jgi:hypothetical protein